MKTCCFRLASLGTALVFLALAQGCSGLQERRALRVKLAQEARWESRIIATQRFDIAAAAPVGRKGDVLTAYLEGDGRAYLSDSMLSGDPTPSDPVALRMAIADVSNEPLLYLARPCQYTMPVYGRNCSQMYWSSHRYNPAIIDSIGEALDMEKRRTDASTLVLVGYSGGGAIATLLAQRRTDVSALVTVAANLDLAYWTGQGGLTALQGSIDPATHASGLSRLPQLHLSGADDKVVPPEVVRYFLRHVPGGADERIMVVPGFDHVCCWATQWSALMRRPELWSIMHAHP